MKPAIERASRRRRPNPRLAKIHRNYTVEEVAQLFEVHRNTVRQWIKHGLPTTDSRRPMLVLGRDLATYLQARRAKNKRRCEPGEIYCLRCRAPRRPAGDMADYVPLMLGQGNLVGLCPCCESLMYRRVSAQKLDALKGGLEVTLPLAQPHIGESAEPSENSDFAKANRGHGHTQPG